MKDRILHVAVACPLHFALDYLCPSHWDGHALRPGIRLKVPFRGKTIIGVLMGQSTHSDTPASKLKTAVEILDDAPLLPEDLLALLQFVAQYYHAPIGEVVSCALPRALRQGKPAILSEPQAYMLTAMGQQLELDTLKRAPKQRVAIEILRQHSQLTTQQCRDHDISSAILQALCQKNLVTRGTAFSALDKQIESPIALNPAQQSAVDSIVSALGTFQCFSLAGVTGSGKTEVYLQVIRRCLDAQQQVLILVPEIALTPQTVARFQARFAEKIAVLHSELSDGERLNAWLTARSMSARIIIGTRSAIFTPMPKLGLIIIDESHDLSFKQQDGVRYNAKDIAIMRASRGQIPIVLGTATPTLETTYQVQQQKYQHLSLPTRAGDSVSPTIELIDLRQAKLQAGLSPKLISAIKETLAQGQSAMLFINRRGYAPSLLCHHCGYGVKCKRCDTHLVLHQKRAQLRCHHCDAASDIPKRCPDCLNETLRPVGIGTERIEEMLASLFTDTDIIRIDRDTTRNKGELCAHLSAIKPDRPQLIIGTQMLAKGHHFPNMTLVGIINVDHSLFSTDFRATERLAQLITQVAGRAGRTTIPGRVLLQTHQPMHPLLLALIERGFEAVAQELLLNRQQAHLPPYTFSALLRSESLDSQMAFNFLNSAKFFLKNQNDVEILGPITAPLSKRAGKYRFQLLLLTPQRSLLHQCLVGVIPQLSKLPQAKKVRWSIDVDPQDLT